MYQNNKSTKAIDSILAAFQNGNLPQAIAASTFDPPSNIPMFNWSAKNRVLAYLDRTGDARGFQQWKAVGRNVKKGAQAIYILGPKMKKREDADKPADHSFQLNSAKSSPDMKCVGFHYIPVFRMEDTEGEPLEYAKLDIKSLPLADVARRWNLDVKVGAFNGNYYGYHVSATNEIVLATDSERTFVHELAHAAHYRVDPNAAVTEKWEREIIAELSAGALLYMMGKDGYIGNHFNYIASYAEDAKLSIEKACMHVIDTCLKVIEAITTEADMAEFAEFSEAA